MKEKISQFLLVGSICLCILKVHRIAWEDQALILRRKTRVQYNNWAQEHFLLILAFTQPCRADVNSFSTAAKQKLDHQMEEQLAEDEVATTTRSAVLLWWTTSLLFPIQKPPFVEFSKTSLSRFSSPVISDSCRLASLDGIFCACTVPSLRPSRKVHSSALRCLRRRPSHSCWPRPQSTAAPLDTGRDGEEEVSARRPSLGRGLLEKPNVTFGFDNLPSCLQTRERRVAPNSSHFKQRLFCLSWLPRPNCAELGENSAQLGQCDFKKRERVFVLSLNCRGYKHIDSPLLQRLAIQHGCGGGKQQGKRKLAL